MDEKTAISAFIGISFVIKVLGSVLTRGKKPDNVEKVGYISRINLYPCKSLRGIKLPTGLCTQEGLHHPEHEASDRCLVIVKGDVYVRPADVPKISTIGTRIEGTNQIWLTGDDVEPILVTLKQDTTKKIITALVLYDLTDGQDCGDEVAAWISSYLHTPGLRMMFGTPGLKKRQLSDRQDKWTKDAKQGDQIIYNNTHPYLILSEAGMDDYNQHTGEKLKIDRFRPNFIVSGCPAFDEDNWSEIWIGDVKFSNHKPCQRCANTMVDPATGAKHPSFEPLKTLNKYRDVCADFPKRGIYGALLVLDSADGTISEGDAVYVTRKTRQNGTLW